MVPEAANKRFLLTEDTHWFLEIGQALHEKWGDEFPVTHTKISYALLWLASWFDSEAAEAVYYWGVQKKYDNSYAKEILGIKFRDPIAAACEMSETLIATGVISAPKSQQGKK